VRLSHLLELRSRTRELVLLVLRRGAARGGLARSELELAVSDAARAGLGYRFFALV
jgi:hypothetical protein